MKYHYKTPLGGMIALGTPQHLTGLYFDDQKYLPELIHQTASQETTLFQTLEEALQNYFDGHLNVFNVPLSLVGTPFQKKAWDVLQTIPYGETITYKQQAQKLNISHGYRACGQANSRNPIAIIIPCHRVIKHNRQAGGYSGTPQRKEWLLVHESSLNTTIAR